MTLIRKINPNTLFWFCLLLAFTLRVKYETNFPQLDSDYATETEAAKNFVAGHGFSIATVNPENLNDISYTPLRSWPIGYAMALLPFYYISGSFISAAVLLQCTAVIILIFGFLKLFKTLGFGKNTISLFLIFIAFSSTPFCYLGTTDLLTGALFLWVIAMSIDQFNSDKTEWRKLISISLLLVISCMLRFACIPNLMIIPFFFAVCAVWKKKYKLLIPASIIMVVSLVGTVLFFSIYKIDSARTSFLQNLIDLNFYFKHLLWFDSFPIKALFFPRPYEFRLPHNLMVIRIFRISLHLASFFFAGYLLMHFIKKVKHPTVNNQLKEEKNIFPFLMMMGSAILIISSFLSMESITTVPESNSFGPSWMPRMWTFVYSTRYFVIPILLFQVLFFMMVNEVMENITTNKIKRTITKGFYGVSLLATLLQWAYTTKQYHFGNGAASFWTNGKSEITTFKILNESQTQNPSIKTIYSYYNRGPEEGGSMTLYSKAHVCKDYHKMMAEGFKHTDPIILYLLMPNADLSAEESSFISTYKPEVVEIFNEGTLYKVLLK
jgi:hypothetical protein